MDSVAVMRPAAFQFSKVLLGIPVSSERSS
jgi:hypothetical protein